MGYWDEGAPTPSATPTPASDYWNAGAVADPNAKLKATPTQPSMLDRAAMGMTGVLMRGGGLEGALGAAVGMPDPRDVEPTAKGVIEKQAEPMTDMGAMIGGATLGGMSPVAPGIGAVGGAALGSVGATRLDDYVNNYLFGDDLPPANQPGTMTGFQHPGGRLQQSAAIGAAAEAIPRAGGWAMANLFGVTSAATEARAAAKAQQELNAHDLDVLDKSGESGQSKFRGKMWELENQAQEKATTKTEQELGQLSEKKSAAEKEQAKRDALLAEQAHAAETEKARGELLGRTREASAAARSPEGVEVKPGIVRASPEELARKKTFTGAVFDIHDRLENSYGEEFQQFEKDYGDKNIPKPTHLGDAIGEANSKLPGVDEPGGRSAQITNLLKAADAIAKGKTFVEHTDPETGLSAIEEVETLNGPTVRNMRQLRQYAQRVANKLTSATEAAAADDIASGADRSLEQAVDVPMDKIQDLRTLNDHYRDFRQHWDRPFLKAIAKEPEPSNSFKAILQDDPARANRMLQSANPEQKRAILDMAADHMNDPNQPGGEWTIADINNKLDKNVIKNMYGEAWSKAAPYAADTVANFKTKLATDPISAHDFGQRWAKNLAQAKKDSWIGLRTEGMKIADTMGPAGQSLKEQFKNAMNEKDAMAIAQKFANTPKAEFLKAFASTQKTPLGSARDAIINGKPSELMRAATRFTRFRALFYTAAFLGGAASGHVSPTIEGLAAITGAMAIPVGTGFAGRMVLRNPAMADILARMVLDPSTANMAKGSVDLISAAAAQRAKEKVKQQEQAETP
jgi:hypothetical protein